MEYTFCDGLQHGSRTPRLYIVKAGEITRFNGHHIKGLVAIQESKWNKNGKWSANTYHLELANGATPIEVIAPLHGEVWPENCRFDAYQRFIKTFPVSFDTFDTFLKEEYTEDWKRMLEGEAVLDSLDAADADSEVVEISTYRSTEGTPHSDVRVTAPDGHYWIIAHEAQEKDEVPGVCRVLGTKHTQGPRGGITTLKIGIGPNVRVGIEGYRGDAEAHDWALGRNGNGSPPPASES